jgi:hypothetical protein
MKRKFDDEFKKWAESKRRKPLILLGARQVGKTYYIQSLNKKLVSQVVKLDFIEDSAASLIFMNGPNRPLELLQKIERHLNLKINLETDLLFFDEVQQCPEALQALKYFSIELPQLKIVAAGSFLGFMSREKSFPIGYVDFISLGPLSYAEFIMNSDHELYSYYEEIDPFSEDPIDPFYHRKLLELFRIYLALGGLPEVIKVFLNDQNEDFNGALLSARKIQKNLLLGYQADFAKYAGTVNAAHILHIFAAIPIQLSQYFDESVGKFKFSQVIPNNKGLNKISGPLEWLEKARLVIKTLPSNKAIDPIKAYTKENFFKLYFFDVGLLQASLNIPIEKIVDEELGSYKGYIAENFVAQELFMHSFEPLYSWSEGEAEIEFLIHLGKDICPIEVKSSARHLRAKSLESFIARYKPKRAIKLAPLNRGYNKTKNIQTIPIYLAGKMESYLIH